MVLDKKGLAWVKFNIILKTTNLCVGKKEQLIVRRNLNLPGTPDTS